MRALIPVVLLCVTLTACGGRTFYSSWDGGVNNNNGAILDAAVDADARPDANVQPDAAVGECTEDTQCTLAIRTDNCCEMAYPELRANIEADQCLARWPLVWDRVPQTCLDAWDPECAYIDCIPGAPEWRSTACAEDGTGCISVPECSDASDCTLAMDMSKCCPCPEAVPAALIDQNPCLVPHPQGGNFPQWCTRRECPEMPCEVCLDDDPPQCDTTRQVCWNEQPGW